MEAVASSDFLKKKKRLKEKNREKRGRLKANFI
jgi:hypothetical protein